MKTILVIEDETDINQLLKTRLESLAYNVITAFDGEEGFNKYLTHKPDLIILDVMLPKKNGLEVAKMIRRDKEDDLTPIIMLTALTDDVDRIMGRVKGANKYISKPFKNEELIAEIVRLLNTNSV